MNVNEELKFSGKFKKKLCGGQGGGSGGVWVWVVFGVVGLGGQGGSERIIEVFVKIKKKEFEWGVWGGQVVFRVGGGIGWM